MTTNTNIAGTEADARRSLDDHRRSRHAGCFVCDPENKHGLGLCCQPDGQGGVAARFQPEPWMVGYEGRLHGGIISALLDGAMTQCLFAYEIQAVTAVMHTRFRQRIPLNESLQVKAWIDHSSGSRYQLKGQLLCRGQVLADAEALFLSTQDAE